MKFLYYDLIFLAIFCLSMALLFLRNKKNVSVEGKFFIIYRTKIGLNLINFLGSRFKKTLKVMSGIITSTGYLLMVFAVFLFVQTIVIAIKMPEVLKIAKVPPIMPLIPYLPQIFNIDFLPPFYFTYWIIAVAIIAIFHESAHGIFSRFYKVRVKSTGFGFLGPFLAAFVEPDEKQLAKKGRKEQIAVLSAGSFANLVIAFIFIAVIALFFYCCFVPQGVQFETYVSSAVNISSITAVSNRPMYNPGIKEISSAMKSLESADIIIRVNSKNINLTKISTLNSTYFAVTETLKRELAEEIKKNTSSAQQLLVFDDTPALHAGLQGAITKINSQSINNMNEFGIQLSKLKPNEEVTIEVINKDYSKEYYRIMLSNRTDNSTKAFLGVGFLELIPRKGILGLIGKMITKFKSPNKFYVPRYSVSLTIFIYNLLWWIIMINLSVAIVNMLPLGIFDGGRVFYLTMLTITKSDKKAKFLYKAMTYLLLGLVIALTVFWAFVML
ncbi:MAG: site-2 protease family protein [archaeon]